VTAEKKHIVVYLSEVGSDKNSLKIFCRTRDEALQLVSNCPIEAIDAKIPEL
jgi:hypothetical protein